MTTSEDLSRRLAVPSGARERIAECIGRPVVTYLTIALTTDDVVELLVPDYQDPSLSVRLLERGLHRLLCDGCGS